MLIDVRSIHKGTNFEKTKIEVANIPRIGESLILPELGYLTVKRIEHDYTQNPVVTTLFCN